MTTTTVAPALAGLFSRTGREPIALERVEVAADANGLAATVTITQHFRNAEKVPLEVVYVFPLDEGAAVRAFEAVVDGTKYVGEVKEREEAFRDYDDAMEAGHGGFLLDEERPDVFTASLGNLAPGSRVDLALTYVTELGTEGRAARFTLPTTVSPRYAPAPDRNGVGRTDAEALNPPVALDVPYRFTFEMKVTAPGAIARIDSPSHPIGVEQEGARAVVRLSQRDAAMDRDLVIVIDADGLAAPHAVIERDAKGLAAMLTFVPEFASNAVPAEIVFLIDRSGSMAGSSIREVRNALQLCLRSLSDGCRFNLVSFGSSFSPLFPESREYDDASLKIASDVVGSLEADMGGTEIAQALEFALTRPAVKGLARQVVLLTDGEVTNTDEVVALARRHVGSARVFTFGIGAGASHHLVRAVARASGGAAEFIAPGERIETKVLRQFKRLVAPALLDVRVAWPGNGIVQAPQVPPAVFAGERLVVYGLAESMAAGVVTLTGTLGGQPFHCDVAMDPSQASEGLTVGPLAARARIRDLEEQPEFLAARRSRQGRVRDARDATSEVVALGIRYQLCSRATSFVAVEHRETPTTEPAQLRRVPVMLTSGWGGVDDRAPWRAGDVRPPGMARPMAAPRFIGSPAPAMSRLRAAFHDVDGLHFARATSQSSSMPEPRTSSPRPHDALVRLQRADGSWELDRDLANVLRQDLRKLKGAVRGAQGDPGEAERALATALALAWLDRNACDSRDEWEMLAEKALRWLERCRATPAGGGSWRALAESTL